jgi:phytoene dehydrogenase-like protein
MHIKVCEIVTPEDFRMRNHLDLHVFGGVVSVLGSSRVPHQSPISGLWFVGAQSESGGGINNVIPSAHKVARKIINEEKQIKKMRPPALS